MVKHRWSNTGLILQSLRTSTETFGTKQGPWLKRMAQMTIKICINCYKTGKQINITLNNRPIATMYSQTQSIWFNHTDIGAKRLRTTTL